MTQVTIREGDAGDVRDLVRIQKASPGAATWPEENYGALLNHERRALWVAEMDGAPAGFLLFDRLPGDEAEILNLAVAPEFRRRGIAAQLLDRLRAETASRIYLEVRASNTGAQAFYERLGFQRKGERKAYYHRPVEDAWLYVCDLSS